MAGCISELIGKSKQPLIIDESEVLIKVNSELVCDAVDTCNDRVHNAVDEVDADIDQVSTELCSNDNSSLVGSENVDDDIIQESTGTGSVEELVDRAQNMECQQRVQQMEREDLTPFVKKEPLVSDCPPFEICVVGLEPEPLMCFPIVIGGLSADALVDSGASTSLIKQSMLLDVDSIQPFSRPVAGLGGRKFMPIGIIAMKFKVGSVSLESKFVVVRDDAIGHSVILGENFMLAYGVTVNLSKGMLSGRLDGGNWEVYLREEGVKTIFREMPVYARQDQRLDGGSATVVQVYVVGMDELEETHDFYYDGQLKRKDSHSLVGEQGVLRLKHGASRVNIENCLSDGNRKKIKLRVGEQVGTVSTVVDLDDTEIISEKLEDVSLEWTVENIGNQVDLTQLGGDQSHEVLEMLLQRSGALSKGENDVSCAGVTQHRIELHDTTPIRQRARRFPDPINKEIERQCEELKQLDIIEHSKSPWSSPIVPIRKKDGSIRMCIDYRKLNDQTKADSFPIPNMNDMVFGLHGTQYFTSIDLVKGYYQVPLHPDSMEYTAFSTVRDHYQFKRLSFGLKNAPGAFQREMQAVLSGFDEKQVVVYIDDILIMSETYEEHLLLVDQVLEVLHHYQIKVKLSKCHWFKHEVKFLGHIVGRSGLRKSDEYMKAVREFPRPITVKQLRSFLGLVNFQRKFIEQCSVIAKPLSRLMHGTDKQVIVWTDGMVQAFEKLKEAMEQNIELAYPDYSGEPLELSTDASGFGAGACLSQRQEGIVRVIAYASMSFNGAQCNYSTIERELAAIRWAVGVFRCFLYGKLFLLYTDHRPLVYMSNMSRQNARIMRTMNELEEFEFEIRYRAGKDNTQADIMSRLMMQMSDEDREKLYKPSFCDRVSGLPDGFRQLSLVQGGGDSMIESLWQVLRHRKCYSGCDVDLPVDADALRVVLVDKMLTNCANYGVRETDKKTKNRVKLMKLPGQLVDEKLLTVFCDVFKVQVWIHYDMTSPVVYEGSVPILKGDRNTRVHLQCLAGVHYNPLEESVAVHEEGESEPCSLEVNLITPEMEDLSDVGYEECYLRLKCLQLVCGHEYKSSAVARTVVKIGDSYYCALIDTGAQISLVSEGLWNSLSADIRSHADFREGGVKIKCVGGMTTTQGIVNLELCIMGQEMCDRSPFAIVKDDQMPFCVIIGAGLIRLLNIELDFRLFKFRFDSQGQVVEFPLWRSCNVLDHQTEFCLAQEEISIVDDTAREGRFPESLVLDSELKVSQQRNFVTRMVYRNILEKVHGTKWLSKSVKRFARYAADLRVQEGVLWYVLKERLIAVVPFSLLVDVVLQTHWQMNHVGRNKLMHVIRQNVWHPALSEVVADVCASCPLCQRYKVCAQTVFPPTLRIETARPFELVAVDLVNLPKTRTGYIGCFVAVDHFTKWLTCIPIKDKRAHTIASVLEHRLLPCLPGRIGTILSDNGAEFTAQVFSDVLEQHGVGHLFSTPYKPSSNGAVERINRTVLEMLRCSLGDPVDWDLRLAKVVMVYNHTWHSQIQMSPSQYLMSCAHSCDVSPLISEETKTLWRVGHPSFASFRRGDQVLKKCILKGHSTINKLLIRYEGPYRVVSVRDNGVTYEVEDEATTDVCHILRVHHSQIKRYVVPPKYIVNNARYMELISRFNFDNIDTITVADCEDRSLVCPGQRGSRMPSAELLENSVGGADFSGFDDADLFAVDESGKDFITDSETSENGDVLDSLEQSRKCAKKRLQKFDKPVEIEKVTEHSLVEIKALSKTSLSHSNESVSALKSFSGFEAEEICCADLKSLSVHIEKIVNQGEQEERSRDGCFRHSTPVSGFERRKRDINLTPIGRVTGNGILDRQAILTFEEQVECCKLNQTLDEVVDILTSQEVALERLELASVVHENCAVERSEASRGSEMGAVQLISRKDDFAGLTQNSDGVLEQERKSCANLTSRSGSGAVEDEVVEALVVNKTIQQSDSNFSGFINTDSLPGPMSGSNLTNRRVSFSPIKTSIREARALLSECSRRGRARLLMHYRNSHLGGSSLELNDVAPRTPRGESVIGYQTRSRGSVPDCDNVQRVGLELFLRRQQRENLERSSQSKQ